MTDRPKKAARPDGATVEEELWEESYGFPPDVITVYERADKGYTLYLRRWDKAAGNWRRKSLGKTLRDAAGAYLKPQRALNEVKAWARLEAKAWHDELTGAKAPAETPVAAPLTIGEAYALVSDPGRGQLRTKTRGYHNEVKAALEYAVRLWGAARTWNTIRKADLRELGRRRLEELAANPDVQVGYRAAEITVARIITVANWLRDDELIDEDACVPPKVWKKQLAAEWTTVHKQPVLPEPARPRHELAEVRRILARAWDVDPRLGLLLELGAELRAGQVERVRRTHVDLATTVAPHGRVTVHGRGKKRGAVVHLTSGQRAALDLCLGEGGYLARLERAFLAGEIADYPLFPQGQMVGGRSGRPIADLARHATAAPISKRALNVWFREAEGLAEVEQRRGRLFYGARRAGVDAAKHQKISRDGMKELGGWADTQIPDTIYADAESSHFREEARLAREQFRGGPEAPPATAAAVPSAAADVATEGSEPSP